MGKVFKILKDIHYNGPFLIEMWSENYDTVEETRYAIKLHNLFFIH